MEGAHPFARESLGYLSRRPVAHAQWHRPRLSRHAFVELIPEGAALRIFGVHLSAVHAAWTERAPPLRTARAARVDCRASAWLPRAGRRLQHARARGRSRRAAVAAAAAAA